MASDPVADGRMASDPVADGTHPNSPGNRLTN